MITKMKTPIFNAFDSISIYACLCHFQIVRDISEIYERIVIMHLNIFKNSQSPHAHCNVGVKAQSLDQFGFDPCFILNSTISRSMWKPNTWRLHLEVPQRWWQTHRSQTTFYALTLQKGICQHKVFKYLFRSTTKKAFIKICRVAGYQSNLMRRCLWEILPHSVLPQWFWKTCMTVHYKIICLKKICNSLQLNNL